MNTLAPNALEAGNPSSIASTVSHTLHWDLGKPIVPDLGGVDQGAGVEKGSHRQDRIYSHHLSDPISHPLHDNKDKDESLSSVFNRDETESPSSAVNKAKDKDEAKADAVSSEFNKAETESSSFVVNKAKAKDKDKAKAKDKDKDKAKDKAESPFSAVNKAKEQSPSSEFNKAKAKAESSSFVVIKDEDEEQSPFSAVNRDKDEAKAESSSPNPSPNHAPHPYLNLPTSPTLCSLASSWGESSGSGVLGSIAEPDGSNELLGTSGTYNYQHSPNPGANDTKPGVLCLGADEAGCDAHSKTEAANTGLGENPHHVVNSHHMAAGNCVAGVPVSLHLSDSHRVPGNPECVGSREIPKVIVTAVPAIFRFPPPEPFIVKAESSLNRADQAEVRRYYHILDLEQRKQLDRVGDKIGISPQRYDRDDYRQTASFLILCKSPSANRLAFCGIPNALNRSGCCRLHQFCPYCCWKVRTKAQLRYVPSFHKTSWHFLTGSFTGDLGFTQCIHRLTVKMLDYHVDSWQNLGNGTRISCSRSQSGARKDHLVGAVD